MCHEKYVRFVCGCGDVRSALCEYAEAAVECPFWLKLNCPYYSIDHLVSTNACSMRFYCAKSRDAEYLNDLWQRGENATNELNRITMLQRRLTAMAEDAGQKGVPDHVCKGHPQFKAASSELACRLSQRHQLVQTCSELKTQIHQVQRFYDRYGSPNTPDRIWSQTPSFVDTFGIRRSENSVTSKLIDASRSGTLPRFPDGVNITAQSWKSAPPTRTSVSQGDGSIQPRGRQNLVTTQDTPFKRGRKWVSPVKDEVEENYRPVRRSARVTKKKINYGESDGSSPVRATSPGESDVSGFDPSSKSDSSGSPERSPPKRRRSRPTLQSQSSGLAGRDSSSHSNSMASKLNEYRERMSRVSSPADVRVKYETPAIPTSIGRDGKSIYQILPGLQTQQSSSAAQLYGNTTVSGAPSSRPPTRYGPPNRQGSGYQGVNNFSQQPPPAMPNFLSNQQGQGSFSLNASTPENVRQYSQPTNNPYAQHHEHADINKNVQEVDARWLMNARMQPAQAAPVGASSSSNSYDPSAPHNQMNGTTGAATSREAQTTIDRMPPESPYDRMRRSFSATADLPSPAITDMSPTTTDPKKRKQPVSSPGQHSNKRLRLSLPGEEVPNSTTNSPAAVNQALPTSSPSKMQSQTLTLDPALAPEQDGPSPTPAPNFAPTAVMFKPSQAEIHVEDPSGVLPSEGLPFDGLPSDSLPSDGLDIYSGLPTYILQPDDMGYGDDEGDMLFGDFVNEEPDLPF